jgi:predicted nucleic acid-binding protein
MILVDTSILSTFARVDALDLLWALFPRVPVGVTPVIYRELQEAVTQGCGWLEQVPGLIRSGRLQMATPTSAEVLAAEGLPDSLGLGEREAISLCQSRGWSFVTNDRRARNYCREAGVEVFDLAGLLRALWTTGVRPKKFVRGLLERMEEAESIVFKNKAAIFQRPPR